MKKRLIEEMHPEKEWFEEARDIDTIDGLASFVGHILYDYEHDYGTACHAVSACALAAAHVGCKSEGLTGFQAGFVMWDFIRQWLMSSNKCGMKLIDYDDFLFPQYDYKFEKIIKKDIWETIQKQAKENLENHKDAHEEVRKHWQNIVNGIVPFGYKVVDDDV